MTFAFAFRISIQPFFPTSPLPFVDVTLMRHFFFLTRAAESSAAICRSAATQCFDKIDFLVLVFHRCKNLVPKDGITLPTINSNASNAKNKIMHNPFRKV